MGKYIFFTVYQIDPMFQPFQLGENGQMAIKF